MRYRTLAATTMLLFSLPAFAGSIISSVDRAAFASAVATGTISSQNFEGIATGTILGSEPGLTYSASQGNPIVTAAFLTTTAPNGLGSTSGGAGFDEFFLGTETATFVFSESITAFAIDINTFAVDNSAYSATLNTGDIVTSLFEVFPGQITGAFIGFVSDTPFNSVTISAVTGFSYTLDTLVYGSAAAVVVPLPSALILLLTALPLLARRRGATG